MPENGEMFGSHASAEEAPPSGPGWWARVQPPRSDLILAVVLSSLVIVPPLLLTAPLAWRRRYPMAVFGIQVATILIFDPEFKPEQTAFVALLVGGYSVAAYHPSPTVSAAVLFAFGAVVTAQYDDVVVPIPARLTTFALLVPLWLAGNSSRLARARLDATSKRAEQERDEAIAEERARIARELHDVVTHNVSVMVVQASAARQVLDSAVPDVPLGRSAEAASARAAMAAVERVGQQAMAELRHMLGLLGGPGDPGASRATEAPRSPQTGLSQLDALLQRVRYAGVPVSLDVSGDVSALPSSVDLTAYRVVQEALTNVLRHAPGAATSVIVHCGPEELVVEVTNKPPPEPLATSTDGGGGRGLAGLAERVRLHDGELTAGPRPAGGYRVRARIPLAPGLAGAS